MATSAKQALRKELKHPADDCWIDEEWRKGNKDQLAACLGYRYIDPERQEPS